VKGRPLGRIRSAGATSAPLMVTPPLGLLILKRRESLRCRSEDPDPRDRSYPIAG